MSRLGWTNLGLSVASVLLFAGSRAVASDDSPTCETQPIIIINDCQPPSNRVWTSAEYLLWQVKAAPVSAPLVTTGPIANLGPDQRPGTLGMPGTQVLLGGRDIEFGPSSGGRFTAGVWLGNDQRWGVE